MPRGNWTPPGGWSAYHQARRAAAVTDGRCYDCQARPALPDHRLCQTCIDWHKRYRNEKIAAGYCRDLCGALKASGRTRCLDCLDLHALKQRVARGKPVDVPIIRRPPRPQRLSTSVAPPAIPIAPADGQRKVESAPPAEVDLSQRRSVIAALARRKAAA